MQNLDETSASVAQPAAAVTPPARGRVRRWWVRILLLAIVAVLTPVAFYFYASWQGERDLRAAVEELNALGEPWQWDELLDARPALADADNIRGLILVVRRDVPGSFYASKNVESVFDRPSNVIIPPGAFAAFDEEMRKVAAAAAEARKLADRPRTRLAIPWTPNPITTSFAEVQHVRELAFLLRSAAAWHAQQGDLDAAVDDCLAILRAGHALQDEYGLICHLVQIAIEAIGFHALERVLAQGQPAPEQLHKVQRALEGFDSLRSLANSIRGERAFSGRLFEEAAHGKLQLNFARNGRNTAWWERVADALTRFKNVKQAHAWTLRHHTEVLQALDLPERDRLARLNDLEQEAKRAPGMARDLMPGLHKLFEAHRRREALARTALAALAAERFRRDQGAWPKTPTDLVPKYLKEVPADPYGDGPLRLRHAADGIVFYSVGPDGQQRGTYQEDTAANRGGPGFIRYEFRLWNVSQRRLNVADD